MKIVICSIILLSSIFGLSILLNNDSNTELTSETLSPVPKSKNEHVVTMLSGDEVLIGVDKVTAKPYLHLDKWGGEVSLKVDIPYRVQSSPVQSGNKLVFTSLSSSNLAWWQKAAEVIAGKVFASEEEANVVFYTHEKKNVEYDVDGTTFNFVENENGGIEFDVVFDEPLVNNVISFAMETDNLEFAYQPPLDEEPMMPGVERCSATTCWDESGVPVSYRPENVIRSYAVYYDGGKSGNWSKLGGKDYKTGKVFHIYRPKIYDAAGLETWGELKVEDGSISVTVPQDFLDQATYPVTVDPSFGYTSIGASSSSWAANHPRGTIYALDEDGDAESISMYSKSNTTGTHYGYFAIYDSASTATLMGSTTAVLNSQNGAWMTGNIQVPVTLTAGNYRLVSNHASGQSYYVYYDSATNPNYPIQYRASITASSWPTTISSWTQYAYQRVSSYVTYTSSNPDVTPPTVSVSLPTDGAATSSTVTLVATASDDDAVAGVSFYVAGGLQGSEDTSSPYSISWDSTATTSGSKAIFAVARDDSNNYATSSNITITVDNDNPLVSTLSPTDGATDVAVTANLVITFDEAVDAESGNIVIYKASDDSVVETIDVTGGLVTGSGTTIITINPSSSLAYSTDYYVQIASTAFDDALSHSYGGISNTTSWNFSTAAEPASDSGSEQGGGGGGLSTRERTLNTLNRYVRRNETKKLEKYVEENRERLLRYHERGEDLPDEVLELLGVGEESAEQAQEAQVTPESVVETVIVKLEPATPGRDLDVSMEGDDVKSLQLFLIKQDKGPSARELKRVGATGLFGIYTKNALGEYQKAVGILPFAGYFGEITRSFIEFSANQEVWWN